MTYVVGIDPSLTACGIAMLRHPSIAANPNTPYLRVVGATGSPSDTLAMRARRIGEQHLRIIHAMPANVALVVIEALPRGVPNPAAASLYQERAALYFRIVEFLVRRRIPVAEVHTTTLKLWATGDGRADKGAVLVAMRDLWPSARVVNHNQADALSLATMGGQQLGWFEPELTHHFAPKVTWPQEVCNA